MSDLYLYPCPNCGGLVLRPYINVGKVIGFECIECKKVLPKSHCEKRKLIKIRELQ